MNQLNGPVSAKKSARIKEITRGVTDDHRSKLKIVILQPELIFLYYFIQKTINLPPLQSDSLQQPLRHMLLRFQPSEWV